MPPLRLSRNAALAAALATLLLILWAHTGDSDAAAAVRAAGAAAAAVPMQLLPSRDACRGWDPHAPPAMDPPKCLRARQYRQISAFWGDVRYHYDAEILDGIRRLENCTLGTVECPPEPLVVSTWWFMYTGWVKGGIAGEEVWMKDVGDMITNEGFIVLAGFHPDSMLHLTRMLSLSLHMVWMNENNSLECASNPRCIRIEDYRPAENARYRHNLNQIPKDQMGAIPLWKLFTLTYWGSRPSNSARPGFSMHEVWGVPNQPGGDEVWSFQPLGRQWQITPFPYPGHTWVPISMERECKSTPPVPPAEREDTILVLGKRLGAFREPYGERTNYTNVTVQLERKGVKAKFVSTLRPEKDLGETEEDVPTAFSNVGVTSRKNYTDLVSHARAMYGMSNPSISPSPLLSLCRGTPVVLPYYVKSMPKPEGWYSYSLYHFQHGPIMALGEPYAYSYLLGDEEMLVNQLKKAYETPIEPYVPKGYAEADTIKAVHRLLHYDHHGEYLRVVKANGGKVPRVPGYMLAMCWARDACYFGAYLDEYIGD